MGRFQAKKGAVVQDINTGRLFTITEDGWLTGPISEEDFRNILEAYPDTIVTVVDIKAHNLNSLNYENKAFSDSITLVKSVVPRISNANRELAELIRNRYFQFIPMEIIKTILAKCDLRMPNESYLLTGSQGKDTFPITDVFTDTQIARVLSVSWYRMDSGKFEIVAYIG